MERLGTSEHLLVQSLAIVAGQHPVLGLEAGVQGALLRGGGGEAGGAPRQGTEPGCRLCQAATRARHQGLVILILKSSKLNNLTSGVNNG